MLLVIIVFESKSSIISSSPSSSSSSSSIISFGFGFILNGKYESLHAVKLTFVCFNGSSSSDSIKAPVIKQLKFI